MNPEEIGLQIEEIEPELADEPYGLLGLFDRNGRKLMLGITDRLRKNCQKNHVWKSRGLLATLKNAAYGFDETVAHSSGGRDGIFLLDRSFKPENEMMVKIFDHFLDRGDGEAERLAAALGTRIEELKAVRLVSHHMRLVGVLWQAPEADWLILIDCDLNN
jgi:hypothetical protein